MSLPVTWSAPSRPLAMMQSSRLPPPPTNRSSARLPRADISPAEAAEMHRVPLDAARFAHVAAAIEAIAAGSMVILVDDEDRENEGDLVLAADAVTPEAINFMAVHARGLICLAL